MLSNNNYDMPKYDPPSVPSKLNYKRMGEYKDIEACTKELKVLIRGITIAKRGTKDQNSKVENIRSHSLSETTSTSSVSNRPGTKLRKISAERQNSLVKDAVKKGHLLSKLEEKQPDNPVLDDKQSDEPKPPKPLPKPPGYPSKSLQSTTLSSSPTPPQAISTPLTSKTPPAPPPQSAKPSTVVELEGLQNIPKDKNAPSLNIQMRQGRQPPPLPSTPAPPAEDSQVDQKLSNIGADAKPQSAARKQPPPLPSTPAPSVYDMEAVYDGIVDISKSANKPSSEQFEKVMKEALGLDTLPRNIPNIEVLASMINVLKSQPGTGLCIFKKNMVFQPKNNPQPGAVQIKEEQLNKIFIGLNNIASEKSVATSAQPAPPLRSGAVRAKTEQRPSGRQPIHQRKTADFDRIGSALPSKQGKSDIEVKPGMKGEMDKDVSVTENDQKKLKKLFGDAVPENIKKIDDLLFFYHKAIGGNKNIYVLNNKLITMDGNQAEKFANAKFIPFYRISEILGIPVNESKEVNAKRVIEEFLFSSLKNINNCDDFIDILTESRKGDKKLFVLDNKIVLLNTMEARNLSGCKRVSDYQIRNIIAELNRLNIDISVDKINYKNVKQLNDSYQKDSIKTPNEQFKEILLKKIGLNLSLNINDFINIVKLGGEDDNIRWYIDGNKINYDHNINNDNVKLTTLPLVTIIKVIDEIENAGLYSFGEIVECRSTIIDMIFKQNDDKKLHDILKKNSYADISREDRKKIEGLDPVKESTFLDEIKKSQNEKIKASVEISKSKLRGVEKFSLQLDGILNVILNKIDMDNEKFNKFFKEMTEKKESQLRDLKTIIKMLDSSVIDQAESDIKEFLKQVEDEKYEYKAILEQVSHFTKDSPVIKYLKEYYQREVDSGSTVNQLLLNSLNALLSGKQLDLNDNLIIKQAIIRQLNRDMNILLQSKEKEVADEIKKTYGDNINTALLLREQLEDARGMVRTPHKAEKDLNYQDMSTQTNFLNKVDFMVNDVPLKNVISQLQICLKGYFIGDDQKELIKLINQFKAKLQENPEPNETAEDRTKAIEKSLKELSDFVETKLQIPSNKNNS